MNNAKKLVFAPRETPRFDVVTGGRKPAVAIQLLPTQTLQEIPVSKIMPSRHRGLFLVGDSNSVANVKPASSLRGDYFEQARRIVAQVEQEIQQQIVREGRLHKLAMQPCTVSPATESSMFGAGIRKRLARFLGF